MIAVLFVSVVAIICAPFPPAAKVLALIPIGFALLMMLLDEWLTMRARRRARRAADTRLALAFFARLAALPEPEWAQVVQSIEYRRLRRLTRMPSQRTPGAAS